MVFSKSPKVDVTEYALSVHFGIALGPLDAIERITIADKTAWEGPVSTLESFQINKPNLFGGPKKEGGPQGQVYYLPGGDAQVLPQTLASRLGLTTATAPAYRGLASIWFYGDLQQALQSDAIVGGVPLTLLSSRSNAKGFIWGNNNPQLPTVSVKARRAPKGLNPGQAMIGPDANPSHIIYEALTNTDWGMGESTALMDLTSFNTAAETLIAENFGISLLFVQQTEIETFVQQIIDHIQAALYINPRTGLWTLKLLRDDYDPDTLPRYDDDDSSIQSFQRRGYGETINEIVVSWTNPESEEQETVSAQDLAGITAQGGRVISDSRDYAGVRNHALANTIAARDLRSASAPLASVEATLDRRGWDVVPGAVIKLSSEEHNFTDVIFRVTKVSYGRIDDSKIQVSLVEDIFSFSYAPYLLPVSSQWTDTSQLPEELDYVVPFTSPNFFLPFVVDEVPADTDAVFCILAAPDNLDTFEYGLAQETLRADGESEYEVQADRSVVGRGFLSAEVPSEAFSNVETPDLSPGESFASGNFVMFEGASEAEHEFALIGDYDADAQTWRLQRGVMDTVPRAWPVTTPIWVFSLATPLADENVRPVGEVVTFKLLPETSLGTLELDEAAERTYTLTNRAARPLRPANVKINGVAFGEVDAREAPSISATWSRRNRLTETETLLSWTASGVTPEDDQTVSIEIRDLLGTLVNTIDNLSTESYTFADYDFAGLGLCYVRFISKRDGISSLQGHELLVRRLSGGWGYSWGFAWGG